MCPPPALTLTHGQFSLYPYSLPLPPTASFILRQIPNSKDLNLYIKPFIYTSQ